jgi:hypothetical protein
VTYLCGAGWGRAGGAQISDPGGRVELGEDLGELPAGGADDSVGAGLDGLQDRDALDRVDLLSDGGLPPEGDGAVACDGISSQDGEADGWLSALALNVGLGRGEGRPAERDAGDVVDGVGGVDEIRGQKVLSDGRVEAGQGGDPLGFDFDGYIVGNAVGTATVSPGTESCWGGRGDGGQGDGSDDAGETHVDVCGVCDIER